MSGKNQFPNIFNWQATAPVVNPWPANQSQTVASGVVSGVMTSTNVIYSQVVDVSKMDNVGLEVTWSGNPTGVFQIMVSNSGNHFYALTFNPVLAQPSGSAGGYAVNLNQIPFKFLMLQYINTSGSGLLTVYGQNKDLN